MISTHHIRLLSPLKKRMITYLLIYLTHPLKHMHALRTYSQYATDALIPIPYSTMPATSVSTADNRLSSHLSLLVRTVLTIVIQSHSTCILMLHIASLTVYRGASSCGVCSGGRNQVGMRNQPKLNLHYISTTEPLVLSRSLIYTFPHAVMKKL